LPVTKNEEEAVKFTTGDANVHPIRGAGVVERIVERATCPFGLLASDIRG